MRFCKKFFIGIIILTVMLVCNTLELNAASKFNIKGTVLQSYNGGSASVLIPDNVKTIGKKAFVNNKKVKKVVIKQGVSQVRPSAFKGCKNLQKIEIPTSVKKIANNAFSGCKNLTIIAQNGTYALKFAKKNGIKWSIVSKYNITGIECYMYTAGTYPCYAEKKVINDASSFDKIYESLLRFNSEIKAADEDMISGGEVLRVIINFSDKESKKIECNPGVYMEDKTVNKLAQNASISEFWDSIDAEITEEIL